MNNSTKFSLFWRFQFRVCRLFCCLSGCRDLCFETERRRVAVAAISSRSLWHSSSYWSWLLILISGAISSSLCQWNWQREHIIIFLCLFQVLVHPLMHGADAWKSLIVSKNYVTHCKQSLHLSGCYSTVIKQSEKSFWIWHFFLYSEHDAEENSLLAHLSTKKPKSPLTIAELEK